VSTTGETGMKPVKPRVKKIKNFSPYPNEVEKKEERSMGRIWGKQDTEGAIVIRILNLAR